MNKFLSKFNSLFILARCFLIFLFSGKSNKKTAEPKKILIVQMAKLGDMVCTTPIFRAIKSKYPHSLVYVMGDKINKEILQGNQDVDRYFVVKDEFLGMIKALKQEKIDFACVTAPNFLGLAMLYLAGIPLISAPTVVNGSCNQETRAYKILSKLVTVKKHAIGSYAGREYLKLLEPIGISSQDTKKYLFFSEGSKQAIHDLFVRNNISLGNDFLVCISPSAGNKLKLWGESNFAQLANLLAERHGAKIFVIGGKNDLDQIREMVKSLDPKVSFSVFISVPENQREELRDSNLTVRAADAELAVEVLSLDELKALISEMSLYLSADTGPIYIAEAFDVPTIDITGPVDEKEQPPIGERHRVVFADVPCRPCSFVMHTARSCKNQDQPFICFKKITAEMVAQEAVQLIDSAYKNSSFKK